MSRILPFGVAVGFVLSLHHFGCGGTECGNGTYEEDGVCHPTAEPLTCAAGFRADANKCVPDPDWGKTKCDPKTTRWDDALGICVGFGTVATCDQKCPQPTGGNVCVAGKAYDWVSFVAAGADSATPIKSSDKAVVKLYNLTDFLGSDKPTAEAVTNIYNDAGCFIFTGVKSPLGGMYIVSVEDEKAADNTFAFSGGVAILDPSGITETVDAMAITEDNVTSWGNNLLTAGSIFAMVQDVNGKGVEGAVPLQDGNPPPFAGGGDVFYFSEDPGKAPYFTSGSSTSKSGVYVIRAAPFKSYSVQKTGCVSPTTPLGTYPGRILFGVVELDCS